MGTRLAEETVARPKPMVEIGGKPILWHIMNIYEAHGFEEFVVALGYKADVVKEYFLNYFALNNDLSIDLATGAITVHGGRQPRWRVHLVDTGVETQTGGRLKRLKDVIGGETFMATYGDGLSNVHLQRLFEFHRAHGRLATVTAVRPPARFGEMTVDDGACVRHFAEKPQAGAGWINGGYFVLEPGVLEYITGDDDPFEVGALARLAREEQLMAFLHDDFFQPMDTLREKNLLEHLWSSGTAPWKVWR